MREPEEPEDWKIRSFRRSRTQEKLEIDPKRTQKRPKCPNSEFKAALPLWVTPKALNIEFDSGFEGDYMAVISFSFTSIKAEHTKAEGGKIKVSNNVQITSVEPSDINFADTTKSGVKFEFEYKSSFEPKLGKIELKGNLIFLHDADKVKSVLEVWKKDKKVIPDVASEVINNVLNRSNVQALIMARDVNLPSPVPMPKMRVDEQK